MKAEQLQLALRPRRAFEAVDLGVRMAQRGRRSLVRAYLPLALLLVAACGATIEIAPWLPSLLLWWFKPWLDRTLLNIYARQAFGEETRFADAWEARRSAPWLPMLELADDLAPVVLARVFDAGDAARRPDGLGAQPAREGHRAQPPRRRDDDAVDVQLDRALPHAGPAVAAPLDDAGTAQRRHVPLAHRRRPR